LFFNFFQVDDVRLGANGYYISTKKTIYSLMFNIGVVCLVILVQPTDTLPSLKSSLRSISLNQRPAVEATSQFIQDLTLNDGSDEQVQLVYPTFEPLQVDHYNDTFAMYLGGKCFNDFCFRIARHKIAAPILLISYMLSLCSCTFLIFLPRFRWLFPLGVIFVFVTILQFWSLMNTKLAFECLKSFRCKFLLFNAVGWIVGWFVLAQNNSQLRINAILMAPILLCTAFVDAVPPKLRKKTKFVYALYILALAWQISGLFFNLFELDDVRLSTDVYYVSTKERLYSFMLNLAIVCITLVVKPVDDLANLKSSLRSIRVNQRKAKVATTISGSVFQ